MSRHSKQLRRTDLKVHLIWAPKKPILTGEVDITCEKILEKLCEEKGLGILDNGSSASFIHLHLSYPPKLSVSDIVAHLKSKSALLLFEKFPHKLKSDFWAEGYYASSDDAITDERIRVCAQELVNSSKEELIEITQEYN
jgi:putative transposase